MNKFLPIHKALRSFSIFILSMQPLNSYLSKMLFHTKINQFIIDNDSIIIIIISKHILYEIMYLIFILMKYANQEIFDFTLLKLHVMIIIEANYLLIQYLTNSKSKLIGFKLKLLLLESFLLYLDKSSLFVRLRGYLLGVHQLKIYSNEVV